MTDEFGSYSIIFKFSPHYCDTMKLYQNKGQSSNFCDLGLMKSVTLTVSITVLRAVQPSTQPM